MRQVQSGAVANMGKSGGISYAIVGNAGVAGATLTPSGGIAAVTADASGDYAIVVPSGWSGTVTPSLTGYTFTPTSKTYTNVTTNDLDEDYVAALDAYTQFTDDFARSDGAVGNDWVGATWTIASGEVLNTPNLGDEKLVDGGVENWDDSNHLTSWTEYSDGGNSLIQESSDKHAGSYSARLYYANGGANNYISQALASAQRKYLHTTYWEKTPIGKYMRFTADVSGSDDPNFAFLGTGEWVNRTRTIRTTLTGTVLRYNRYGSQTNGASAYFDDASSKLLTDAELFITRPAYATADFKLDITIAELELGTLAGIIFCLDDPDDPQNYVIVYHNGSKLWVKKVVSGGDFVTVSSKTQDFSANDKITVVKLDTSVKVYLNDIAIADTLTISDATIKDNLYAGIVSSYAGNKLDDWSETVRVEGGSDDFFTPFFSVAGGTFAVGDSITVGATDEVTGLGYPPLLNDIIAEATKAYWSEITPRAGHGGYGVLEAQDVIDADLAATSGTPDYVLILFGANDVATAHWPLFDETSWKADYQYIIDAIHTKWSSAKIYLGKSYREGNEPTPSRLITLAGWIDDLVTANPGVCYAGIDTRDIYTGNEDELLIDDVHPNHAGFIVMAQGWATLLGY